MIFCHFRKQFFMGYFITRGWKGWVQREESRAIISNDEESDSRTKSFPNIEN